MVVRGGGGTQRWIAVDSPIVRNEEDREINPDDKLKWQVEFLIVLSATSIHDNDNRIYLRKLSRVSVLTATTKHTYSALP